MRKKYLGPRKGEKEREKKRATGMRVKLENEIFSFCERRVQIGGWRRRKRRRRGKKEEEEEE